MLSLEMQPLAKEVTIFGSSYFSFNASFLAIVLVSMPASCHVMPFNVSRNGTSTTSALVNVGL